MAAKNALLNLKFPERGIDRKYAFGDQPTLTSPNALNVRPRDPIKGRARGGSRPGLGRAYYEQLGSGTPIRGLWQVTALGSDAGNYFYWSDTFTGQALGPEWATAAWATAQPLVIDDLAKIVAYAGSGAAVHTALGFDPAQPYQIEMAVDAWRDAHHGTYSIFARLDNTTPNLSQNGIAAELTLAGGTGVYSGQLRVVVSGVTTTYAFATGNDGAAKSGWFKLQINGNNVKVFWLGHLLLNQDISSSAGSRIGFGLACTGNFPAALAVADMIRVQGIASGITFAQPRRTFLAAAAGGKLYAETKYGELTEVTGTSAVLSSDHAIQGAAMLQRLYLADYSTAKAKGTDGNVSGTSLTASSISNWSTLGIDVNNDVVTLFNVFGTAIGGVYRIASVAAGGLTLAGAAGTGACSFRVERAAKVYNPATNTVAVWTATTGHVPPGCRVIAVYRGRMVLANQETAPHLIYYSRTLDPLDFDYAADDASAAVAGQSSAAGQIGEEIRALIPWRDDYLVIGCPYSLWVLRGDPVGGTMTNLSYEVGMVDFRAWCQLPDGALIFMARDGLYALPSGATTAPEALSRKTLPQDLIDADPTTHQITMGWDAGERVVHIFQTTLETRTGKHWAFHLDTGSFWADSLQIEHEPTAVLSYKTEVAENSRFLLGGRDGRIRFFSTRFENDDGADIPNYVFYEPVRCGGSDYHDGLVTQMNATLARWSGEVAWSLHAADTAEAAAAATAQTSGSWAPRLANGRQYSHYPRVRGGAISLRLAGDGRTAWGVEEVGAMIRKGGKERVHA